MTSAPVRLHPALSAVRRVGFAAKLSGATLSDLVQMECLSGARRVVRVTTDDDAGYLYFRDGRIVHAMTRSSTGEGACLNMLQWESGAFEVTEREWPQDESVSSSWQSLLLRAAQARDEDSNASPIPSPSEVSADMEGKQSANAAPLVVCGRTLRVDDYRFAIALTNNGESLWQRGTTDVVADASAYAIRLIELVGEELGLEGFRAMECKLGESTLFFVVEPNGNTVVLAPQPEADLSALREWLGV